MHWYHFIYRIHWRNQKFWGRVSAETLEIAEDTVCEQFDRHNFQRREDVVSPYGNFRLLLLKDLDPERYDRFMNEFCRGQDTQETFVMIWRVNDVAPDDDQQPTITTLPDVQGIMSNILFNVRERSGFGFTISAPGSGQRDQENTLGLRHLGNARGIRNNDDAERPRPVAAPPQKVDDETVTYKGETFKKTGRTVTADDLDALFSKIEKLT